MGTEVCVRGDSGLVGQPVRKPEEIFSPFFWTKSPLAMANKRQRIAKRRFAGASSSSSAATISDGRSAGASLSVKKKSISKARNGNPPQSTSKSSSSSKTNVHPLRKPGSKPGDGCFICKSADHVAKTCSQKVSKDKHKVRVHMTVSALRFTWIGSYAL